MCCFSRPVQSVSSTKIFARAATRGRQFLAYSMNYSAREELAMVLPLPVAPGSGEDAVQFISLEGYPDFFTDLWKGFPPRSGGIACSAATKDMTGGPPRLKVVSVGNFDASYVPTMKDFDRLDERFRIPAGSWEKLPGYRDYGFAVFKLKPGEVAVHPMVFTFPRARPRSLFFPTLHIHDGEAHQTARFDHWLYCQRSWRDSFSLTQWQESGRRAHSFMDLDRAAGVIDGARHCYLRRMAAVLRNEDVWLGPPA